MDFFITNLGQDRAVLGHPFLKTFNPNIDWKEGKICEASSIEITPKLLATHDWKVWKADGRGQWKMDWPNNTHLRKVTFAQQWAAKANELKKKLKEEDVPRTYQHHRKVFSETEVERLPPTRDEDMEIPFKDDASQELDCKVYPLTAKEITVRNSLPMRSSLNVGVITWVLKVGITWGTTGAMARTWTMGLYHRRCEVLSIP